MNGFPDAYGYRTISLDCGPTVRSTIARMLRAARVERHLKTEFREGFANRMPRTHRVDFSPQIRCCLKTSCKFSHRNVYNR